MPLHHHDIVDTMQNGSVLYCFGGEKLNPTILTVLLKSRIDEKGNLFFQLVVPFWWACVNWSIIFLGLADIGAPGVKAHLV